MGGTKISPFCKGGIKGGLKNEKGKVKINPPISPFFKGGATIPSFVKGDQGGLKNEKGKIKINPPVSPF
jgi:hypothetical protein